MTFTWTRIVKRMNFQPLQRINYEATPKFPHDSDAHDRELLEAHYGQAVAELSAYHFNGRTFRLADGTEGRLAAR